MTPDLVVAGIVAEMKSVREGCVWKQVVRANSQLTEHIRRHGHGPGAIILDVEGPELPAERVEEGISRALSGAGRVGFDLVYAFNGGGWQTYAPGSEGIFRLRPSARPFAPASDRRISRARARRLGPNPGGRSGGPGPSPIADPAPR